MIKYEKDYRKYKNRYLKEKYKTRKKDSFSDESTSTNNNYDLIIIGGGSGGISAALEASKYNKKIALFDYVTPSPLGTTWDLGGACVNVGCIPKKLFNYASNLGYIADTQMKIFGWESVPLIFNWNILTKNVHDYIKSLNFKYKNDLKDNNIDYYNLYAKFIDKNSIEASNDKGVNKIFTGNNFIIATGQRPKYLDIPGAKEYGITSDDLFTLQQPPNDTLIIGGSYVGLECGSFLKLLGYNVTIVYRGMFLKNLDQEMVNILMKQIDLNIIETNITKIELVNDKKRVFYNSEYIDVDTVIFAVGRQPQTFNLNLDKIGVNIDLNTGKIITENEQTNIPNIYAVGDIIKNAVELTSVAVRMGKLLSRRLFNNSTEILDYNYIPSCVFSAPLEYAFVGFSEEKAKIKCDNKIEIYHQYTDLLEWSLVGQKNTCYLKLICDKNNNNKIIGLHIISPNASEIIQGYVLAIQMGATINDLNKIIGIHPTFSETIIGLNITKASGINPQKSKC